MGKATYNFTFPMIEYGSSETPWDLYPLLYRGGAGARVNKVSLQISQGQFGKLLPERVELVTRLHDLLAGDLSGGGSRFSAQNKILALRQLFAWGDSEGERLSHETIEGNFVRWCDHLLHRYRVNRSISEGTLYDFTRLVATMLDRVLGRESSMIRSTRIRKPRGKGKIRTSQAEKQNLQVTFDFGYFLADICNELTLKVTKGTLPVRIPLRSGQVLEQWSGLQRPHKAEARRARPQTQAQVKTSLAVRNTRNQDSTIRTRYPLVNLRIEAEMMMFIAQTGVNLQQAHTLRLEQFHYTSHLDGYQVRAYKNRRNGEVLFEIYANYRYWFERYLAWLAGWFSSQPEGLLFPLVRSRGRNTEEAPQFTMLDRVCRELGIPMVRPKKLRGVRINWLLRETQSPEQIAELAQHSVETLISVYADPHPQLAMVEVTRFHQQTDPSISPPAPGQCVSGNPEPMQDIPQEAPRPDCITAAGCLFCTQHRDIESDDHVWSLTSLRYLKSIELAGYSPPKPGKNIAMVHPALTVVDRLSAKLRFFEESSAVRKLWVEEARARIKEGEYHPAWDGFIRLAELQESSK